jgi:hypothetical protein
MRQLIDQDQLGVAGQRGVDIELFQRRTAILDQAARQQLEIVNQRLGLGTPVRLDIASDDIHAGGALLVSGLEHGIGLADAGGGAEEDFQTALGRASLFGLDAGE